MTDPREPQGASTADRILDVAESLVQRRGFNGFSYAHIASELGITKASLHYHYPTKSALGRALIERYSRRFFDSLAVIEREIAGATAQLQSYAEIYASVVQDGRFCLCGMLAAEYETLSTAMRDDVVAFFDKNQEWLVQVLDEGLASGAIGFTGDSAEAARALVSGLEGAMLVARPYGDPQRFRTTASQILASLRADQRT